MLSFCSANEFLDRSKNMTLELFLAAVDAENVKSRNSVSVPFLVFSELELKACRLAHSALVRPGGSCDLWPGR